MILFTSNRLIKKSGYFQLMAKKNAIVNQIGRTILE